MFSTYYHETIIVFFEFYRNIRRPTLGERNRPIYRNIEIDVSHVVRVLHFLRA